MFILTSTTDSQLQLGFLHAIITLLRFSNLIFQKPTFQKLSQLLTFLNLRLLTVLSIFMKAVNYQLSKHEQSSQQSQHLGTSS